MSDTITKEPTQWQASWDVNRRRLQRNSWTVFGVWLVIAIAVMWWVVATLVIPYLGQDDTAVQSNGLTEQTGSLVGALGLTIASFVFLCMLYLPVMRYMATSSWMVGTRPDDDFKPREAKPIEIEWEQADADNRIARVGRYTFTVKRFQYDSRFKRRQPQWSYKITFVDFGASLGGTLDSSLFDGNTQEEIDRHIERFISFRLEDHTDHFTEPSYVI